VLLLLTLAAVSRAGAQAGISGRVLAAEGRTAISGAVVTVQGQASTATTDSSGRFSLRGLKGGFAVVITRAVRFRPDTARVELFDDESVSRDILLQAAATTLGEVVIRDSALLAVPAKLREFEERRKSAVGGRFLDSTVIRKWDTRKTGDLLSTVAGIDVQRQQGAAYVLGGRATQPLRPSARPVPCFMDVYIDGAPLALGNTKFDVNGIGLDHVAAIEVYAGVSNTPARYNRTSGGCGVVLIWTK
jgi:hypothetical protein